MRARRVFAAAAVVMLGASAAALVPGGPAGADVALVDVECDLPSAGGLGGGFVPDTQTIEDLEVELVDSPDPVAQGQPLTYAVDLPVPNITDGLDLPAEFEPYGTLEINHVVLSMPIPAGFTTSPAQVSFTPASPWLTVSQSGSNLLFRVESTVAGDSPTSRSPMRLDLDAAAPEILVQQSPGVWVPVTPLPQVTIAGTASGAGGSTIDVKPPSLTVQVQYTKQVGGGILLDIAWNDSNVPCVPLVPTETITTTAIVAPAPALSVSKALAVGDDVVTVGETIDYTVTVANSGNVPLTGVTLTDPNATCEPVVTALAVSASDDVACSHVATVGDVGSYSNTATADSTETDVVVSNTVETAVQPVPAPGLSVSKALAEGDDVVTVGETIDYTVTVANSGNVPLTGVTLTDPNATCEPVVTALAVSASDDVACSHVATVGDVGSYSNTATADSDQTNAVASNTVSTTVTAPVDECLPPEFPDVSAGHQFFNEICWMVDAGITQGYLDGTFRPSSPVTRQAMAAFLLRLRGEAAPGDCVQQFQDVGTTHPFFEEICWMVREGITTGYAGGTFKPGANVSRAAMAAFLYRFEGEPPFPDPLTATFPDVGVSHTFFTEVQWMVAEGITGGYSDNTFRPAASVTRQSMAAFLYRLTHPV
jgi:hypothetical protein